MSRDDSESDTSSIASSTQPTNLTNNPTYQLSNLPPTQSDDDTFYSAADSQPSQATMTPFQRAFGGGEEMLAELRELEDTRATVLRPTLEDQYSKVECSQLSKHMWSHAKDMEFGSNYDLYMWILDNWDIEIVSKMSTISAMRTAGTKNCQLCMQERVKLFHAFHDKANPNLMNSRRELYGKCTCRTRFLRLSAVGNAGADEAT